jgi:PAS domain S-box-containing protein
MFMAGYSFCKTSVHKNHCGRLFVFIFLSAMQLLLFLPWATASHGENHPVSADGTQLLLDSDEKNWLNSHPVIRVAGPKAFPPFHFFDADGHARGMACDYLDLIMTQLGVRIEQQGNLPWPEVLKMAMRKEIDVINSAAQSDERQAYLLFSDPILSFPIVIITRKNAPFIGKIDDLRGMKVAFVRENIVYDWIRRDEIAVEPHFVATPLDALSAVSAGVADAHIENLAAAAYLMEKFGLVNLKIAAPTPYQNYTLHFAVRKDWPELVSIVNKAIHALRSEQHAAIRNKWLTVRYEFGIRAADIWKWAAIIAIPLLAAIIGILFWNRRLHREITDRKRAEAALRNSDARLRMIAENTGSFIAVLDHTGIYEFANPAHRKFGFSPEELIGTSGLDVIHPDDRERLKSIFQSEITEDISTFMVEYRIVGKDGLEYAIEGKFDSIRSSDGTIEKIVFVGDDITQRKEVEARQAAMEIQDRQILKVESLERMAGAIAHHFNNQLHVVMGNLEMARDDLGRGKSIDHSLSHALQSAQKASDVSTLMLTYLGQPVGKPEALDLAEICRLSLPVLQAAVPPDGSLESDIPPSGPVVTANPGHIQQMLKHLITNAWESLTTEKKEIRLTVETLFPTSISEKHRFPIDWKPSDSIYACLSVSDTGIGIAAADIEKLFDPFFTTKFTGRGLGLSIIIGIVRAYNGAITVESEPGHGSVFRIFLPVSDHIVSSRTNHLQGTHSLGSAGTVMLVEDDEMVRDMVSEMFSHIGMSAILAKDGIDALALFREHSDDIRCVLTDMTMPRMNGWELISALKSIQPNIPIILTSGYDEALVMDDSHPDQPTVFLHKPYTMNELKYALMQAFQ